MPQGTFSTYKILVKDTYPHVAQQIISVQGIPAPTNSWCKAQFQPTQPIMKK